MKINGFNLLNVLKDKQTRLNMLDEDVVRLCLLIASELVFMGKEKRNFLMKHIMWLVDDFDAWSAFPWGEYRWEKFYNSTVNVVSRHTEHHLAELKKNLNFNATYNLYGFAWAFKLEEKICPKMYRMSVDDGDGVLDSQSDDGDGVLDSQTKDVIEQAAMLPTMSSNSPQAGNAAVSEFFVEFDALKKQVLLIKRCKDDEFDELTKRFSKLETSETFFKFKKLLTNDLCSENESSECNQKKSNGVSIEEKPNFSSHHNDSLNHNGGVSNEAKASSSSAHPGNDEDMSHLDDNMEIDGQNAKDGYIDDPMYVPFKPKVTCDVDSYDDDYMSLFNDEEQPAKSSLNDRSCNKNPIKLMSKMGF
ncbi:hypothetical protein Tco_0271713 [Tanacetum coccineum]